jgi:hypothetical protein
LARETVQTEDFMRCLASSLLLTVTRGLGNRPMVG